MQRIEEPLTSSPGHNESMNKRTKKFQTVEYKALSYSGMQIPDEIASYDVSIGTDSWVHQICCGFQNKEDLVLLHGYGGTGMTFIRVFKDLAKRFRVHALDFLGMGLSHRKEYNHQSDHLQSISYYVESIELWRQAAGIKSFVLAGHSFGGYIASCYAKQFPNHVQRLVLISPPGVMYMDSDISNQLYQDMRKNATWQRKIFMSLAKTVINRGTTPSSLMNWTILGNMFLNRVLTGRLKLKNQQKQTWKQYMNTVTNIQPNSERSFFRIFHFPRFGCKQSIEKIIQENKFEFPIEFYYGDNDWMESNTAKALVSRKPNDNNLSFTTIENSGHQVIFDNPQSIAQYILQENDSQ